MERARYITTDNIVEIASLDRAAREGAEVARDGYACLGCGVEVRPCAIGPGHKVASYFGTRGVSHREGCTLGSSDPSSGAPVTTVRDTTPRAYPTRFVEVEAGGGHTGESTDIQGGGASGAGLAAGHAVRSGTTLTRRTSLISRVIDAWLEMDEAEREAHPITIPGVAATKYDRLVRFLPNLPTKYPPRPGRHLFAAPVLYSRPLWTSDAACSIRLARGRKGDPRGHYLVTASWRRWNRWERERLTADVAAACTAAREAPDQSGRPQPWLFFLADTPSAGELVFRIHQPQHLAIRCVAL